MHVHPLAVEDALSRYWSPLETWSMQQYEKAREALEDVYSFLLPRVEFEAMLLPLHLADIAKRAKPSSPGLDGWTHREVSALPMQAWFWFHGGMLCLSSFTSIFSVCCVQEGPSVENRLTDLLSKWGEAN